MASSSHSSSPSSSTTTAAGTAPQRFTTVSPSAVVLPASYADAVLLHVLATRPSSVIPPGKSLRAALLRPQNVTDGTETNGTSGGDAPESLQSAIEKIVHRAFWDEAEESLSDENSPRQIARVQLLYKDLSTALEDLLPKSHPSYVRLTNPLLPTPASLQSARIHLIELSTTLQERCAPARDSQISAIRSILESDNTSDLPTRIVEAAKRLLEVAEVMKKDLRNAILGAVRDEDLEKEVINVARVEERTAVLEIFGAKGIRDRWATWLADEDSEFGTSVDDYKWVRRLLRAIGADVAISCPIPTPSNSDSDTIAPSLGSSLSNAVPPVFALSSSDIFHLQNHIQALVIAAVLLTLVPLRPPASSSTDTEDSTNQSLPENTPESRAFVDRVLSLLMIEVDETSEDAGTTKLVNLADEVLREHRRLQSIHSSTPPAGSDDNRPFLPQIDEQTIRARVDALLRPTNPVFVLLRKRLLATLTDFLISALRSGARREDKERGGRVPDSMQTGRDVERDAKRPRLNISYSSSSKEGLNLDSHERGQLRRLAEDMVRVGRVQTKGYEDPVLRRGIGDVLGELADVVEWVRGTWGGHGLDLEGLDDHGRSDGVIEKASVGGERVDGKDEDESDAV